ncbi:MAG: HemK2/MTQ2 family protein methyltransferase [Halobacteriales archaeon]|nr:HemK2/MTQ2 family protein methyltransferase [Halobacteriales archaeon]
MQLAELRGFETEIYEPAEDSALLADVAGEQVPPDALLLDVGTGSGYVAATVAEAPGARVIGSDLNPHACRRARAAGIPVIRGNLTHPIRDHTVDVVTFNPPYLPVDPTDKRDDWFEVALSGGTSGRAVIDAFLEDVGRVLASDGFVLLLVSTLTDPDEVVRVAGSHGFGAVALRDVTYPGETLTVLKLVR